MSWVPRVIGAATAIYGGAVLAKPTLLTEPCKLTDAVGRTPKSAKALARSIGARDLASGLALAVAPSARATQVALAVRVLSDVGDAVVLGGHAPDADTRKKVVGVAAGWALLTALSALTVLHD
ncbi:uncharacterized protein DUF4267 [Labedaea rhizosphaerae]|uniref:Uncharacterized protein DUF4267 n=1 Tax=Labedaea rhizosphaerae TaxID=598644 RepID=A0A4R6SJB1_LABRH|nr:uncharacterized protein DUF4267 [Labedaea rhizosphaerae]